MNSRICLYGVTIVLTAGLGITLTSCSRAREATRATGSTSILPFAEMLAEEFNSQNPDMHVEVQGGGSALGLKAAATGIADIGMCSRELKADEVGTLDAIIIAYDGLSVVVNPANPVSDLTLDQVRDIFTGKITNWKEVGGENAEMHVITREEGSGRAKHFRRWSWANSGSAAMP